MSPNSIISPALLKLEKAQSYKIETTNRFKSKINTITRQSLFLDRKDLMNRIPKLKPKSHIVEVEYGTGKNIEILSQKFPSCFITGFDSFKSMIEKPPVKLKKHSKIKLIHTPYIDSAIRVPKADLILFSYSLSMSHQGWKSLLEKASRDLKPGGIIAIIDFDQSNFDWFRKKLANLYINMDSKLSSYLEKRFDLIEWESKKACLGLWNYFLFIGRKRQ